MTTPPSARPTTVKVPAWEYLVVGALIAASLGYSVACAFAVAAVHSLRFVAAQILAGEHPDLITIQARLHAESHAHAIVSGLGWLILVCYVAWSVVLHRRLQTAGQRMLPSRSRPWAYRIWSFAIVASVILAAGDAAGLGSVRTVADVHRAAGFDIALLVIRGALWPALCLVRGVDAGGAPGICADAAGDDRGCGSVVRGLRGHAGGTESRGGDTGNYGGNPTAVRPVRWSAVRVDSLAAHSIAADAEPDSGGDSCVGQRGRRRRAGRVAGRARLGQRSRRLHMTFTLRDCHSVGTGRRDMIDNKHATGRRAR